VTSILGSQFVALQESLGAKDVSLPPKRILVTSFVPSAWLDDALIAERKAGLAEYLLKVLRHPDYQDSPALQSFLAPENTSQPKKFDVEDAVPSTLSRKAALDLLRTESGEVREQANLIAAAYYPGEYHCTIWSDCMFVLNRIFLDWSAGSNPPENLNYSKFDILFFGTRLH